MFNTKTIQDLVSFIASQDGKVDKPTLTKMVQDRFSLTRDRSVFSCQDFSIRFCSAHNQSFSNTVLSLSALQKYDNKPFFVCVVTPERNHLLISNTTFLRKISHSSQELRINNIKGSFNGSDIIRNYEGTSNQPNSFEDLFSSHCNFTFSENLERLVETTNNIIPTKTKFIPSDCQLKHIMGAVERAARFLESEEYKILNSDLQQRVNAVSSEITIAALIDNINLRGRVIEYLITQTDDLHSMLVEALRERKPLPSIFTSDKLGDYERVFGQFNTATDIKTKILSLSSNPKGYNIDKLLSFLAEDKSVYLIYIVAIDERRSISTRLCSLFNRQILNGTRILSHWAGRQSRGVTQYDGRALENAVFSFDNTIDILQANDFISRCLRA